MISWFVAIPAILILILTALIGLFRSVKKSVIRLVCLIIALLVSIPIASAVARALSDAVDVLLAASLSSEPQMEQLFNASPTLAAAPSALSAVVAAPIIYIFVFIILSLLFFIVGKIISIIAKKVPDVKNKHIARWTGLFLGILCATVIIVGIYAPISGFITIANDALIKLDEKAPDYSSSVEGVDTIVYELSDSFIVKATRALGGKALFTELSSGKLGDVDFSLESELDTLTEIAFSLFVFSDTDVAQYGKAQISAIDVVATKFPESVLLANISTEIISSFSKAMLDNEPFMDVTMPEVDPIFAPLFDKLLVTFSTSDSTNIAGDLATVADLATVIIEKEILANLENEEELLKILTDNETISAITKVINKGASKDRLSFIITEITNICFSYAYSAVMLPEIEGAEGLAEIPVGDIISDFTSTVSDVSSLPYEDMVAEVSDKLSDIANEYSIPIEAEAFETFASDIANEFSGADNITATDVSAFLLEYAIALMNMADME